MKNLNGSHSVVLLSAGLDSTVSTYAAIEMGTVLVKAITFDYGQKAARKEVENSKMITSALNIPHEVISLPFFSELKGASSLLRDDLSIPQGEEVRIENLDHSFKTALRVWVPNRNGIFLNIAAGLAESLGADYIITGFNAEEAQTFPDNSADFLLSLNQSFSFSTYNKVEVISPTLTLTKKQIVHWGHHGLKVPWSHIWPCYFGGDRWCRTCESCQRTLRAFQENKMDPGESL